MTLGKLFYWFQFNQKRGLRAAWNDYFETPRLIKRWENPHREKDVESVPVHILLGEDQYRLCWWMLASWFYFTERNWTIVLHGDESLSNSRIEPLLERIGPSASYVDSDSSFRALEPQLRSRPHCLTYRKRHPLAHKCFDIPHFVDSERYIMLDTDLIFFRKPETILYWIDEDDESVWFNDDDSEACPLDKDVLKEKTGVRLWPRVNSGLCLLRKSIVDLDFFEELFKTSLNEVKSWRIEQTLLALAASRYGKGGCLSADYEVSLGDKAQHSAPVARHYVGAVRQRFFGEGVQRVKRKLIPGK